MLTEWRIMRVADESLQALAGKPSGAEAPTDMG
jgi:hypothetical protein